MKKLFIICFTFILFLVLTACGGKETTDSNQSTQPAKVKIKIGATAVPHAEILEEAIPLLEAKGYELEIVVFQDYVLPNTNLQDGELDANYFQHVPYLNFFNDEYNTDLVNAGGVHIEPIGLYSKTFASLESISSGTNIIMSNSVSDQPRLLSLLIEKGLINLAANVDLTTFDISTLEGNASANPKGLHFRNDIDAGLLVTVYESEANSVVLINTNYALDGGLNPLEDAIALESPENNPYVNLIAVKRGNEDDPKIKALVEVLQSDTIQTFITNNYQGAVIPA